MIKRNCPRCGQEVTLDEQRYHEGSTVVCQCPQCRSDVVFTIVATVVTSREAELQHKEQAALLAKRQQEGITVGTVSFQMVRVAGGTFTMGATAEQDDDAYSDERPTHQVTLSSYWIGETVVTQRLWKEVMGDTPSHFEGNDLPVEQVCDKDIQKFIRKLNRRTGRRFRLPTEAEWEYAARGGQHSRGYKYSGSNDSSKVAWYDDNSNKSTHPVKQKEPNELGIYDMSGNVWEWCSDWHGDYSDAAQNDPQGPVFGSSRVLRGGSWCSSARDCRSSNRNNYSPGYRRDHYGLRLALSE